ncbi:hypothetical protein Micbo1qcDRAFT_219886 [Microdochium bolleyi]|uniref:Uncharacterized protein n=1 Tax=Microdochium bolleyi TaxID=196109 RepID=A0A136IM73_9PEZI|nr:hypothetical protein Micbo1qcDRAFT_219886 [Microdochium bolleyi]
MRFAAVLGVSALSLAGSTAAACVKKSSSTSVYPVTSSTAESYSTSKETSGSSSTTAISASASASDLSSSATVPFCSSVVAAIEAANDVGATAFCSSYLGIPVYTATTTISETATETVTTTSGTTTQVTTGVTVQQTATTTATAYVTAVTNVVSTFIIETDTVVSITSCAPLPATTVFKRLIATSKVPDALSNYPVGEGLSSMCSCLGITASTTTATATAPSTPTTTVTLPVAATETQTATTTESPSVTQTVTDTLTVTLAATSVTTVISYTSTSYKLAVPTFTLAVRYPDDNSGDTSTWRRDSDIWADQGSSSAVIPRGSMPPPGGTNVFWLPGPDERDGFGYPLVHGVIRVANLFTPRYTYTQGSTTVVLGSLNRVTGANAQKLVVCQLVAGPGADGRSKVNSDGTCPLACGSAVGEDVSFRCTSNSNNWNVGSKSAAEAAGCSRFVPPLGLLRIVSVAVTFAKLVCTAKFAPYFDISLSLTTSINHFNLFTSAKKTPITMGRNSFRNMWPTYVVMPTWVIQVALSLTYVVMCSLTIAHGTRAETVPPEYCFALTVLILTSASATLVFVLVEGALWATTKLSPSLVLAFASAKAAMWTAYMITMAIGTHNKLIPLINVVVEMPITVFLAGTALAQLAIAAKFCGYRPPASAMV